MTGNQASAGMPDETGKHERGLVLSDDTGIPARPSYESAKTVLSLVQKIIFFLLLFGFIACAILQPHATAVASLVIITLVFACVTGFKFALAMKSYWLFREVNRKLEAEAEKAGVTVAEAMSGRSRWEIARLNNLPDRLLPYGELPRYTLLVPLFKEATVVGDLVDSIALLDYPIDKLQVLLLVEAEDTDTQSAALQAIEQRIPSMSVVVVPYANPQTKPRACNVGLDMATGDYLVIYDAEDRPETNQLRLAATMFASADEDVVCLQSQLDYDNGDTNLLTRWFTVEYNGWFELILPGLVEWDMPLPLGGTSNHFRTSMLRSLDGWDPFNVTEDADLGVRLYHAGLRTRLIPSTTNEEAVSKLGPWIKQRTRWVKGYIQTWLVHMRRHEGKKLGVKGWVGLQLLVGGTPVANLINPLLWMLFFYYLITKADWVTTLFPAPVLYLATLTFLIGNILFLVMNLAAVEYLGRWHLLWAALTTPIYWLLMSAATYRAVYQLIVHPHYWDKTPHGLSRRNVNPDAAKA